MKLDTSGLESAAPLFGVTSELVDGFSTVPSFELPVTTDVSFNLLVFLLQSWRGEGILYKMGFSFSYLSLMGSRRKLYKW